jgi:site-specific DNA recombinase
MTGMIRCACYVRVSTENQLENYSIDEQIHRLEAYCRAKDYTIVKFYTDGGYSGGDMHRPALQQMLIDIQNEMIDSVIVYKLDRLSRSQKDTLTLIEDNFLTYNVDFISINENFDTTTPFGRAMIGILSVFAQLEKDQITERFTMGRIGRAKNGYFHGGAYAPVGYDYIEGKLIVNEYEALQVKALYERFAKGYPLHDCWCYMKRTYTNKYGAWSSESLVRNVLTNRVYIGDVKFKGTYYKGIHEAVLPETLFYAVQKMFEKSRYGSSSSQHPPFKAKTLLSGLIYCQKCQAKFHGEHGNYSCYSRTKGDARYIKDVNCKNKKWRIEDLDKLVIDFLLEFTFDEEDQNQLLPIPSPPNYEKRIVEIDKQILKLVDLYQIETIPVNTITLKIDNLTKERKTLQLQQEYDNSQSLLKDEKIKFKKKFYSMISDGPLPEKRACLSALIDKIMINDEDIEIRLK